MIRKNLSTVLPALVFVVLAAGYAGEKTIVSLKDMSLVELKTAGIEVPSETTVRIDARGAGGSRCDNFGSTDDRQDMFAYGWIIDANTRKLVWEMTRDNTSRSSRDDRTFDGEVTLQRGSYEVYFAATTFTHVSTFKNMSVNIDHREKGLFNRGVLESVDRFKGWFEGWFESWFGDDIREDWNRRAKNWGLDVLVDDSKAASITKFSPPKEFRNVFLKEAKVGENAFIMKEFYVSQPLTLHIYALGEGYRESSDLVDAAWIISSNDRRRVWDMKWSNSKSAGGASKNALFDGDVQLREGEYALYYVADNSHSYADWNCAPPSDPLNYGITVTVSEKDKASIKMTSSKEPGNVILSLTKIRDDESRSEGFTLKADARVRVYAIGEQSNSRRVMADYAQILDAKTRNKIWTMNADNTYHAGGASKNRFVDEIISLSKGSYVVQYNSDDSHAYDEWNADPPFDPEGYGVTLYGAGEKFDKSSVTKYVDQRDRNIIAQIIRARNSIDKQEKFHLDKTTKIRLYAIGEGFSRDMADYGWISDDRTGTSVWEMTYSMTFHAGGGRKNRMVNTTIILDRGDYTLHYKTDDSHAFSSWNQDPPEDPEYWGITLYPDEGVVPPIPPAPKSPSAGGRYD